MKRFSLAIILLLPFAVTAGVVDPECTAEKAVKSAATKAADEKVDEVVPDKLQKDKKKGKKIE